MQISARPDPPGGLTPTDIDANSVSLTWQKPKNDGGKKIQGYIIEYKEPTSNRWKQANAVPVAGTSFTGKDRSEEHAYICIKLDPLPIILKMFQSLMDIITHYYIKYSSFELYGNNHECLKHLNIESFIAQEN